MPGKTTVLGLILEGVAGRCPVVVVDGKASSSLRLRRCGDRREHRLDDRG